MADERANGRKVFFLYPHSIVRDLVKEIVRNEYEVYIVEDHDRLRPLLVKYGNPIVFINIEERLKEEEWEKYIKDIISNPSTKEVGVGVLTYFDRSKALTEKYLLELGVNCGYIRLKTDINKCKGIILRMLEANEARGKRRFVRGLCNPRLDTLNIVFNGARSTGRLLDVSIAGLACRFDGLARKIEAGQELKDIQLVLRGSRCQIDGRVIRVDRRGGDDDVYVVLFKAETLIPPVKEKIHNFIQICLQNSIEQEMKAF
ncbi:MAG: PilZ domain-containing protein [Spirochaetales bacterium]|nr:PilZ domain-containing protein [Spirochaetales bacterium]